MIPQSPNPVQVAPLAPVVHVIDDDVGLRGSLADLLRSGDYLVETFASPQAFFDASGPESSGCIVLDIRFPGVSGLDAQARFADAGINMPVILMTGHADVPSSVRGLRAGAVDFLVKPFGDEELFAAVALGLERDGVQRTMAAQHDSVRARYETLTARERQVLELVSSGLMNKQVAGILELKEITAKVHRGTMMRKMGVRTLADLVRASETLKHQ